MTVGQTTYLINNRQNALKALEVLRQHREAKRFSEMESMPIWWTESLNPSNEIAPEERPTKKKHEAGEDEPAKDSSITPSV